MEFIPHDIGTFLTPSKRGGHHIVDRNEQTCSCEDFSKNKNCRHLRTLMTTETQTEELQMTGEQARISIGPTIDIPGRELELAPEKPGEAPMKQLAPYGDFKTKIENLRKTAESITVTNISQTAEMKIAKITRLALKDIRVAITHRHKELKEGILVEGRKIDAGKNELLQILEPLELRLKDQEEFIERETARIQEQKRIARTAEITPYLSAPLAIDLGVILDDRYASMLADAKDAHAARLGREAKEKEEAEAKAKAEQEERERIRMENERLKKEAEEIRLSEEARIKRESKLKGEREIVLAPFHLNTTGFALGTMSDNDFGALVEREKKVLADREAEQEGIKKEREEAAAEKARLDKQLADERKAAEAKAAKLKKEAEEAARAAKEKADAEAKAERDAARKREEELAAAAKKENDQLAAIAEQERQKAATAARLAKEAADKADKERADREAAERAEKKRLTDEAAAIAKAPQKDKLKSFAIDVRRLSLPLFSNAEESPVMEAVADAVERFAKFIEKKAAEL